MENIQISDMDLSDLELLRNSLTTEFDDFWSFEIFKSELLNPNSKYFVAKVNNEIVGFAGIWKAIDVIHITNIVVKKSLRGHHIGSLLLEQLINASKSYKDITCVTLEVKVTNLPAIKLYEKYSFQQVGIRKKYYSHQEDALIMTMEVIK